MNLFNYLMAKKGHNTSVRDDLLAYLLGKRTPKEVKTATGTTISITDATREKIVSLTLSKESAQDGTPTPDNPVEIKTVKGYRNLFDKDNANILDAHLLGSTKISNLSPNNKTLYVPCKKNTTYTIQKLQSGYFIAGTTTKIPTNGLAYSNRKTSSETSLTITTDALAEYLIVYFWNVSDTLTEQEILDSIMITEGTEELPYVPYGTNWIYTAISNGTDTNYYTIPLNNNEIAGIGNYKDELIVDKNGHCWLNKKIGKIVLDGSENWSDRSNYTYADRFVLQTTIIPKLTVSTFCNYYKTINGTSDNFPRLCLNNGQQILINFSQKGTTTLSQFKEWLTTHNTDIYYPTLQENLIDLNYTVDIELFKGINNISNSEDMDMTLKYY